MQFHDRIDAIEKRASLTNLSLKEVCEGAGESYATVWRWRQPRANPTQRTLDRVLGKLEAYLDKKEAALGRALARRPGRARPAA
jgi:transcriptional regulator with XRE-family HTH domain